MSENEDTALQAFLRLCIMVGVVVVGAMAYHVYGPPVGDLAGLLDRVVGAAKSALGSAQPVTESPQAAAAALGPTTLGQLTPAPVTETSPQPAAAAPRTQPMAELPPLPSLREMSWAMPADVAPLVEQLRALGAGQFQLAPWGHQQAMQRFVCRARLPGDSGLFRHFEAIAPDAASAVSGVVRDVTQWRAELSVQPR